MNANIQGLLNNIDKAWHLLEHKGEKITKEQAIRILTIGKNKGYTSISEIPDSIIENILKNYKNIKSEIKKDNPTLF